MAILSDTFVCAVVPQIPSWVTEQGAAGLGSFARVDPLQFIAALSLMSSDVGATRSFYLCFSWRKWLV